MGEEDGRCILYKETRSETLGPPTRPPFGWWVGGLVDNPQPLVDCDPRNPRKFIVRSYERWKSLSTFNNKSTRMVNDSRQGR